MSARGRWIFTLAVAAAALVAGRARAFDIVFDGPGGYGISAATAANAQAAGLPMIEVDSISQAAALDLTIPAPDVLSFSLSPSPSVANPNTATSQWSVTNSGEGDLTGTWLVFLNPTDYTASQVGFVIDGEAGWAVIDVFVPMGKGGTDYFYPAVFLGDIGSADTVTFLMHHLVGEALHNQGGKLVLPQYSVGALQGVPVPEPGLLVLLAAGIALVASSNRRNA